MLKNKAVRYFTQFGRRVKQNYNLSNKKFPQEEDSQLYITEKMS
jgi:hypothetical protein